MKQKEKQKRRPRAEPEVPAGYRRVYFDIPTAAYNMMERNAKKHGMTVGAYLTARGMAQPIEVSGDFVTAEMAAAAAVAAPEDEKAT